MHRVIFAHCQSKLSPRSATVPRARQPEMASRLVLVAVISISLRIGYCAVDTIDNGVVDDPEIECAADSINVNFNTKNAFEGKIYIKGHVDEAGCKVGPGDAVDAGNHTDMRSFGIIVPFARCGVSRRRSLNPIGIYVSTVVVITFHPQFLTKIDRAYEIRCFYMAADKTVSIDLGVSDLTTGLVTSNLPMPVCRYEVLDSPTGKPVKFANIGDTVYHKWTCDSQTTDIFCILIHSCYVDDGHGSNKAQLLDQNGCAQDKYLLQNLDYPTDLMAGREAQVFKYADRPQLFFQCQISILLKEGDACNRPKCQTPEKGRKKRETRQLDDEIAERPTLDVESDPINVFEIDDGQQPSSAVTLPTYPPLRNGQRQRPSSSYNWWSPRRSSADVHSKPVSNNDSNRVCMSSVAFTAIVSTTVFVCVITLVVSVTVLYRRRKKGFDCRPPVGTIDMIYGQ